MAQVNAFKLHAFAAASHDLLKFWAVTLVSWGISLSMRLQKFRQKNLFLSLNR